MAMLHTGEQMPNFSYITPFGENFTLADTVKQVSGKTALVFLRYYGCPMCQLDLHEFAEGYSAITAAGGQLLVVLQSDPTALSQQIQPSTFPYRIICDPEMKLYQQFSIDPAPSMLKMMSMKAVKKVIRSTKRGFKHGAYEGNEQQLPATFILDDQQTLSYVRYGKDAGDVPAIGEIAAML